MVLDLLAVGLDPERCALIRQSDFPEHAELAWIFNTVTPVSWAERTPTYKEKRQQGIENSLGLLDYPILQAADIVIYKASRVPVGKDQAAHLELSREIVRAFNRRYGPIFPEPEPVFTDAPTVLGIDGQTKMSKSAGNTIPIFAEPDEIRRLVMSMVTDPLRIKRTDPGRPEVCNVCQLHRFFGERLSPDPGRRTDRPDRMRRYEAAAGRADHRALPADARAPPPAGCRPCRRRGDPCGGCREGAPDPRCHDGRGASRGRHRTPRDRRRMSESKVEIGSGGLGPRERRWLLLFLALGSIYFALLLADRVIGLLGGFASILIVLFLAWLLAFVLSPLVAWLEDRLNAPRPAVVIGTYVLMLIIIGFALFYTGAAITQQVGELAAGYPARRAGIIETLTNWEGSLELGRLRIDLTDLFAGAEAQVGVIGQQILDQAEAIARVTIAALGSLLLIIFLSLYMLMDSKRILPRLRSAVPRQYRDESDLFERTTVRAFGGFLRAQLILAVVQGLLVAVVGTIFGIPYLFLLATTSALLMLIPFFGPPLALVPPIVGAALFAGGSALPVAIILLVAQTLIVNWLQPRLMRDALGLHPILVLVGLLVGAQVAGIWGALFGIPVIAIVWVFVSYALFGTVPNAALSDKEKLSDVDEHVMVSVAKEQVGDETHPKIHVTRTRRADGSEEVDIQTDQVADPNASGTEPGGA